MTALGPAHYPLTDALGSIYAVTDSAGTTVATYSYDVYGNRTQTSGTLALNFGYTGREHDGDTGLIYHRDRYRDPATGGWLQADRKGMVAGQNYYPLTDALGSIYAVTDSSGNVVATWSYDVYGARTQTSGTLALGFGFTGREHDSDTGLVYARQRYRDPATGNWLRADLIEVPGSPSQYLYVNAMPSSLRDPTGLIPVFDSSWWGHSTEMQMVVTAWYQLAASLCVRRWFIDAWGDSGLSSSSDPFGQDITFSYGGSYGNDIFDIVAILQNAVSYWNLFSDDVTLFDAAFHDPAGISSQLRVNQAVMHELNNWSSAFGGFDNSDPERGSYTAETIAYDAYYGYNDHCLTVACQ